LATTRWKALVRSSDKQI